LDGEHYKSTTFATITKANTKRYTNYRTANGGNGTIAFF
jgi:hypothetical protein